jgi:hypothetical protein
MAKAKTTKDPWMKFYPQDWRSDEKLRLCSLAARGLWMEMLCLMHRSERYGHLLISGITPTDAQLAVQVGALPDQVAILIGELETAGVFSRTTNCTIYSRRMHHDQKKVEINRKNGKNGGNPALTGKPPKTAVNEESLNPKTNPIVKTPLKAQKPEARYQKEETSIERQASAREMDKPQPPPLDPQSPVSKVMEAGRFTIPPGDMHRVKQWMEAGADLKEDILPVVKRITSELRGGTGKGPFSFKVFEPEILQRVNDFNRKIEISKANVRRMEAQIEQQKIDDLEAAKPR